MHISKNLKLPKLQTVLGLYFMEYIVGKEGHNIGEEAVYSKIDQLHMLP